MLQLTINEPHWLEPIVQPVKGVTETVDYKIAESGRLITNRVLWIIHEDGETEQFNLGGTKTYKVEPLPQEANL